MKFKKTKKHYVEV